MTTYSHLYAAAEREGQRVATWCAAIADAVREGLPAPGWGDVAAGVVYLTP